MTNLMQYVENESSSEFYPTPLSLVSKMLTGVQWDKVFTVLEPSAGKGDILRGIAQYDCFGHSGRKLDVDCIESDANLRQILKYNFGERKNAIRNRMKEIKGKYKYCERRYGSWFFYNGKDYVAVPEPDRRELKNLESELGMFFSEGIKVIHDDFLTFEPYKTYDLIVMNPPFSNGDKHLLKALSIQRNGGSVICLLNAETIKNLFTDTRRELMRVLNQYNASIEFIQNGFQTAERKTGVEVALIKVSIPEKKEESEIFTRFEKAQKVKDFEEKKATDLVENDYIKAAISRYKVECQSGIELIQQYRALSPYLTSGFGDDSFEKSPILRLTDSNERSYKSVSINDFLKKVRYKYWKALLSNPKFVGKLTSKLQQEYQTKVSEFANYDFSEFNIKTLSAEMNIQIKSGVESEILTMFDRLTAEHSWYPEATNNRHYYDGWATNKAHKIGKKVIIPCSGVYDSWGGKPRVYNARNLLEDIERIFNFLDGNMTADVDSWRVLEDEFKKGNTKNIKLKYFIATFYKKGTTHLVFTCPKLIERFNIYAAQNRGWLPPNYGKKQYTEMTAEEKKVVDNFQGETAYNEILKDSGYYLSPVVNNQMLLTD